MIAMWKFSITRLSALAVVIGLALFLPGVHAQDQSTQKLRKYKAPPPSATIEVIVLKAANGKPVENAAVIFHPIEGDRDKGGMEIKTNEDGKALIDVIPIGDLVRLQIIAKGFKTYGGDFKVDKDRISMEVRLSRPGEQFSIYKNGSGPDGSAQQSAPDPSGGQKPQPK
jgi:hypothetical protein